MRKIVYALGLLLLVACGEQESAATADPRQHPVPRDYYYFKAHTDEADAQKRICDEIPEQARSATLAGNCVAVDSALRMRGFGETEPTIFRDAKDADEQ